MTKVVIESPFSGNIDRNIEYAQLAMRDCLARGEYPFMGSLLYTQKNILNDNVAPEREAGLRASYAWSSVADKTVVYHDFGITSEMTAGLQHASTMGRPVEYRNLHPDIVRSLHTKYSNYGSPIFFQWS